MDARKWIETLELRPHPEGGFFRETYRAAETIAREHLPPRFSGDRAFSTAIYFLLEGRDVRAGEVLQAVVPAGHFFGARPSVPNSFSLVGCTVAPGFDFADFELPSRQELLARFPQHVAVIEQLTRV